MKQSCDGASELEWETTANRPAGESITVREVTEGVLVALNRPPSRIVGSIIFRNAQEAQPPRNGQSEVSLFLAFQKSRCWPSPRSRERSSTIS